VRSTFFFFCPVQSTLQGAQHFFLFLIDRSLPLLGAQITFFCLLAASQQRQCAPFFCSVRSLLLSPAQPARHAADFFSLFGHFSSQPCMRVRGAGDFFSCPVASGQQQLRAQFFFGSHPHSTAVCAAFCSCDQSLCHPRSKENIFFVTSVQKCEGYRARRTFLLRSSFSFAVRSHLRRHLVLIFFGAWNLCSPLFQNPASEI
jgi:hypothetical protein